MIHTATAAAPRHQRLSDATDALHEHLHGVVASLAPFDSRENFARFATVQYIFQREIEPLYSRPALQALLPDLQTRSRRSAVAADLADLGRPLPSVEDGLAATLGEPAGIGWLFVSEGSTLGAAMLLKRAQTLGLTETFGARHLAPDPAGRGKHWKRFVEALDGLALDEEDESELIEGARNAFLHFGKLLEQARGT
jgi:heme oxygenase